MPGILGGNIPAGGKPGGGIIPGGGIPMWISRVKAQSECCRKLSQITITGVHACGHRTQLIDIMDYMYSVHVQSTPDNSNPR